MYHIKLISSWFCCGLHIEEDIKCVLGWHRCAPIWWHNYNAPLQPVLFPKWSFCLTMPDITLPVDKTTILPNGDDIARLDVNDMAVSLLHCAANFHFPPFLHLLHVVSLREMWTPEITNLWTKAVSFCVEMSLICCLFERTRNPDVRWWSGSRSFVKIN